MKCLSYMWPLVNVAWRGGEKDSGDKVLAFKQIECQNLHDI